MAGPLLDPALPVPPPPVSDDYVLEPLGPQHNQADLAAWTGSADHIRATPGFVGWGWPPEAGLTLAENEADLLRHERDFAAREGFTWTVLDPTSRAIVGCLYVYPSPDPAYGVVARSWVVAHRAELDAPLARAVHAWLLRDWPFRTVDYAERPGGW